LKILKESIKEEKKFKILIVDDNLHIRKSIRNIIAEVIKSFEKNYDFIEGSDGVDILKYIVEDQKKNNLIKCVFTDENMEYMDGSFCIEILREMEKENKIKNVNIVSVTSFEDDKNKEIILLKGANFIINKPCNKQTIANILKELDLI